MSRVGEGGRLKKRNCCLTCSIVCFVIMLVFIAALYIGGSFLFKTYVSPHIGGLELNDAIALAANVLSGKEASAAYTEEDLDSFYTDLSSAMFLSDKTEDELEYELVSEEKRAELAPAAVAAAEEDSSEDASYDEDAAYAAFLLKSKSERYALLSSDIRAKISLEEYSALAAGGAAAVAARKKAGLKTYRLSLTSLLGDMNFGAENFSPEKALEKSLSSLAFNFDTLEAYDIENAAAAGNEKFTTFSVNGKQVSAFVNDVLVYFLNSENSPLTSSLKDSIPLEIALTDYVKVASVTIMNTPLATSGDEALYNQKDTALGIAVSIKLRDIVTAALQTSELKEKLSVVPDFAFNLIPHLVPKFFSANLTVYPLAEEEDQREIVVTVNKPSDKNAKRLSALVNALLSKEDSDASKTFFGEINDRVVSVFSSVNETVKINFVPSVDTDGKALKDGKGNTYSEMKIMTWETLLSLIDKEGRLSAHDVFTMLKCLYISNNRPEEMSLTASVDDFKADMSSKYGVEKTYLDENNILSTDALGGILEHIDLKSVDFSRGNDAMRVRLPAEALASFMAQMISDKGEEGTAAAEEDSPASLLEGLDPKVCGIDIKKVSEKGGIKIYSFELVFSADLAAMLRNKLPSDGIAGNLSSKLLPKKSSYFGIMIYLSEYHEGDKLLHKVGKNIDNPAEGETSAYSSKLRINDFSYADTERVFTALNTFMEVLSSSSFDISSITGTIEDAIGEVFDSLAGNDFNLALRLYESDGEYKGGVNLPSLYELVESLVKPKLADGESFSPDDAKDVLYLLYNADVPMAQTFEDAQADAFLNDINDKFYIKKDSALTVSDLFGDAAADISSKIDANAIYFKPSAEEEAKWTGEKRALYSDTRPVSELRVSLSGGMIAALVKGSNLLPSDMISSFGGISVLGASFKTEEGKTYLSFEMKLLFTKEGEEGEGDAVKYSRIFPSDIKLGAKILLFADHYSESEPRYSSYITINDDEATKVFLLMRALGGEDLSEKTIAEKISESVATTFNTLEGKVPLFYSEGGHPYTLSADGEECIKVADIFTFLVKETSMTDLDAEPTDPDDLAERLRGFGWQALGDAENAGDYAWVSGLKLFSDTDDDYIYTNMQRAYFLKEKPDMDDIYNDFSSKFDTIKSDSFNLKEDENGLFYYDGDIVTLKVSDRALALIVKQKQDLSGAVSGEGMTAEISSLKLYHEDGRLTIESGIKIAFDNRESYQMMPSYFFVIAKTKADGLGGYTTTISMNNVSLSETNELFQNINSLSSKGMNSSTFRKEDIESTINSAISTALAKFPSTVIYGEFTAEDIAEEYNGTNYMADHIRVAEGDGYISFPSVYSYLIDMFYTAEKPTEKEMQHMLNSLHKDADALRSAVVSNEKSSSAYHVTNAYKDNSLSDIVNIYSDKYLAYAISTLFATENINGDLSLANGLEQSIVLRALSGSEEQGERAAWKSRFFTDGLDYVSTDNYLIATAIIDLSSYTSGDKASLLPENLWFTVLADITNPDNSKGLLYDMNHDDMAIFEHILSENNPSFNINSIAVEFAQKIKEKLEEFASIGGHDAKITYRLFPDSFSYSETLPYTPTENAANYASGNGVGYIILSLTDIA